MWSYGSTGSRCRSTTGMVGAWNCCPGCDDCRPRTRGKASLGCEYGSGERTRGRLIALRQSAEVTRWTRQRVQRRAQRNQQELSAEALEFAEYFMLWTSLPERVSGYPDSAALSSALADRAGLQTPEIDLGTGASAQKRSAQCASLVGGQTVRRLTDRAHDCRCVIFPLGIQLAHGAAVGGEKLSSCIAKSRPLA